jgi:membrane protein
VSTALVLCCAALVLTALVSLSVLAFLQSHVPDGLPGARLASTVTLFGALTLGAGAGLILIYRYAPAAEQRIPWRHVLPGTIAGVTMWLVATTLFRTYVAHVARFDDTYGSLAAVVVLMLWLMVSAWALLLGARLNAEAMAASGISIEERRE